MSDIYESIAIKMGSMSKTQRKIADYILNNRIDTAFFNVKQLAKNADVSDASIIRFANFLGYTGYSQLQQLFQESTQSKLKSNKTESELQDQSDTQLLEGIFQKEIQHIQVTYDNLNTEEFFHIADSIVNAKRVFIICGRSTRTLGSYFEYYLKLILDNVYFLDTFDGNEEIFSKMGSDDVVIGITFKRYTKKTIELIEFVDKRNAKIIGITDFVTSPILKYTDHYLLAETRTFKHLDSFVAPQVLVNALITCVGKRKNMQLDKRFNEYEEVCESMQLYVD
ncbi:MAG: MurR/RpiR family transcriptional regulator [bacterium]|nr:MurR/RpiR family transcriptional regulator [bacterium]